MNISLKDQLATAVAKEAAAVYPFIRRDKSVRARILPNGEVGESMVLVETVCKERNRGEPLIRVMSEDYFDNNFWEGVN